MWCQNLRLKINLENNKLCLMHVVYDNLTQKYDACIFKYKIAAKIF